MRQGHISSFLFIVIAFLTFWFSLRPFNYPAANDVKVDTANHRASLSGGALIVVLIFVELWNSWFVTTCFERNDIIL